MDGLDRSWACAHKRLGLVQSFKEENHETMRVYLPIYSSSTASSWKIHAKPDAGGMCTPVTLYLIGYRDQVKVKAESLP